VCGYAEKGKPDKPGRGKIPSLGDTELWSDDSDDATDVDISAGLIINEQQIFVELVEDILQSAEGLAYHRLVGTEETLLADHDIGDGTFAVFAIETNPAYDLEVSIELASREFRIHVNDIGFLQKADESALRRPDKWLEKRCLDVEHLVAGDLKLEFESILGKVISTTLYEGHHAKRRQIGHRDEGWGWTSLLSWLLPFGLSVSQTDQEMYTDWYASGAGDSGQRDRTAPS
jgi:hypothetical protein